MDFKHIITHSRYPILIYGLILSLATTSVCIASVSTAEIENADKNFQDTTSQLYKTLANNLIECRSHTRSLKRLNSQLIKLTKNKKHVIGSCLIQNHMSLIEKNIDNKEIFPIVEFLLNNNNLHLADKIANTAKSEGDQSLISNISFIYAKYYVKRKEWNKVLKSTENTYNDLTTEDANLARLFTGIALQKLKKHRQAIKVYSKIPKQSMHYPTARLNIATAYIRQDWWTDAHTEIKRILNSKTIKPKNEMNNRLYLVLGYSLLRKEFYRDAREAFRNIEINSVYFHKALLGIALTATNQEDYIGALNAINILKSKKTYDLSVDESHLLLPYTYEKLNQNMTASASYSDAQKYYQNRIEEIKTINQNKINTINAKIILNNDNRVNLENNVINFTEHYPLSFLEKSALINEFSEYLPHIDNVKLINKYKTLKSSYDLLLEKMLSDIFVERSAYLTSYLNQSRFGLARLFDNSNIANN
jgi:hypothetical protein